MGLNVEQRPQDKTADATAASGAGHLGGSGRGAAGVALVGRASMRQLIGACERIQARDEGLGENADRVDYTNPLLICPIP